MGAYTVVDVSTVQPWEIQGRVKTQKLRQGHLGFGHIPSVRKRTADSRGGHSGREGTTGES